MPPRRRFAYEIAGDYAIALAVIPLAQWLFYGVEATAVRVLLLTGCTLVFEEASRYAIRGRIVEAGPGPSALTRPPRPATVVIARMALLYILITATVQVLIYGAAATLLRVGAVALTLYGLFQLRQHWRDATLEVSLDFLVSLGINLGGQRLIYGTLAAPDAMTSFTAVFLPLSYLRRLGTRLAFGAMLTSGARQPRRQAALEITCDTLLALLSAYGLQVLWYGAAATLGRAGGLTVALYVLTWVRRYVFRRLFDAWRARTQPHP